MSKELPTSMYAMHFCFVQTERQSWCIVAKPWIIHRDATELQIGLKLSRGWLRLFPFPLGKTQSHVDTFKRKQTDLIVASAKKALLLQMGSEANEAWLKARSNPHRSLV